MRASRKNLSTRWVGRVTGEIGMSTFMESPWCGLEEWRSWHVLCHACSLCAWIKTLLVSLSCATVWGRILAGECVGTSLTPVECHLWGKQKKMGGTHKALSSRKFWAYWLYVLRLLKSKIGRGKFRVFGDTFMSVQLLNTLVQYLQSIRIEHLQYQVSSFFSCCFCHPEGYKHVLWDQQTLHLLY